MELVTRAQVEGRLTWPGVVEALSAGLRHAPAQISDQFLTRDPDTLLSRAAWIEGLGFGVKSVSVMPGNSGSRHPTVQGAMLVFEDVHGALKAIIDSDLVTEWKTAGDSVLGARLLARADARSVLIVGAGVVAQTLVRAYSEIFPQLKRIEIWNRTGGKAETLARKMRDEGYPVTRVKDLEAACGGADIISTATMSRSPVLSGDWIKPGTHVDLIGAFRPDMREADDHLMQRGRIFVDSRDTTIHHIGELMIPIAAGAISQADVLGDFYDLIAGREGRVSSEDITVFKNGGGAHLDLMTAQYILSQLP